MPIIPDSHLDLLQRPLFAHLATIRPDGSPQVNPMWFAWDGTTIRFTNSTTRRKHRNVSADPRVSLSINDPDQPYRYLEIRGDVVRIEPDPNAALFIELAARYALTIDGPPADAPTRVIFVVEPRHATWQ